jgi:squalene-hopene/tetraprenyl-beta-curcumene cyclase
VIPPASDGLSRWSWHDFPAGTDALGASVARRLAAEVEREGTIHSPCRSRVLESALALPLLHRAGQTAQAAAVRRYLARDGDPSTTGDPLQATMARAVLGDTADPQDAGGGPSPLSVLPSFLTRRKRMQFEVLGLLTGQHTEVSWDEAAISLAGLHSWARVQVTAVKVIAARVSGRTDRVNDEDVRVLLDTQRGPGIWEGNVFIHLLVLHALALLPRTQTVLRSGLAALCAQQRRDGGFPFVASTDTWSAVTAGVALWSAGAPAPVLDRLAAYVSERQLPGGGWSFTDRASQSDVDCTSVAVQFLHCADPARHGTSISDGIGSILSVSAADGGFPTYVAGAPSEACMTAGCLDALCVSPAVPADRIALGLAFLAGQQDDDGSFPLSWSASLLHAIFRVLLLTLRGNVRADPNARQLRGRCLSYVTRQQNKDGGWGHRPGDASDAISTAYGLICLCLTDDPKPAADAAAFLLSAQRPDGSIHAAPDTLGPRPFPFAVPALADIFTLLGLGHLRHRIGAADRDRALSPRQRSGQRAWIPAI